jgi:uncharacterized protein (TIGR03435 family)
VDDDLTLLRQYARNDSEDAFTALVSRHVNLVYSVALRQVQDTHLAEEITQAVFTILARKADSLGDKTILAGWLCRTARYVAANARKIQYRRQQREQEAHMQSMLNESANDETWAQIAPLLDAAMEKLGKKDHDALVLRFFENRNLREVGTALGASEDAAKMRVNRALEKLRKFFGKQGADSTTAIIAGVVSAHSIQPAPEALAKSVTAAALGKGAAASASTLTLIKGGLKLMAWSKTKTVIVIGVSLLFATGTTTVAVKEIQKCEAEPWRLKYDPAMMAKIPPRVEILPALCLRFGSSYGDNDHGRMGLGATMISMLESAQAYKYSQARILAATPLPAGHYDFIANLTNDSAQALQEQINLKFGLVESHETIETNVYVLTLRNPNAPQLKRTRTKRNNLVNCSPGDGSFQCVNRPVSDLARFLEDALQKPVVDETGLTNHYDIKFDGGSEPEKLKQTVLKEVGLELVPDSRPVEFLVVDKGN